MHKNYLRCNDHLGFLLLYEESAIGFTFLEVSQFSLYHFNLSSFIKFLPNVINLSTLYLHHNFLSEWHPNSIEWHNWVPSWVSTFSVLYFSSMTNLLKSSEHTLQFSDLSNILLLYLFLKNLFFPYLNHTYLTLHKTPPCKISKAQSI